MKNKTVSENKAYVRSVFKHAECVSAGSIYEVVAYRDKEKGIGLAVSTTEAEAWHLAAQWVDYIKKSVRTEDKTQGEIIPSDKMKELKETVSELVVAISRLGKVLSDI